MKYRLLQMKLRKVALNYLFSNKMLCEKTTKRINNLMAKIKALMLFEVKHNVKTTLERWEKLDLIIKGLEQYLSGTESGFNFYQENQIESLIKTLLVEK